MKIEGTSHDRRYKTIFSDPVMVESLLREFVPKKLVADLDFSSLTRIASTYETDDDRERSNDIVWRIRWKNGSSFYVALMLEFQSTQDKLMPLRILSYTALLLIDLAGQPETGGNLPPVLPIVLYNGKNTWKVPQDVTTLFGPLPKILQRYCPKQQYFLLDEGSLPEKRLNRSKEPVLDVIKMERAQTPERIQEVVDRLNNLTDPKYASIKRVFSSWMYQTIQSFGFKKQIPEPKDLQEVGAMLAENIDQWKDQYIAQGINLGMAKGRKEGIAEGMAKGMGMALRDLLENRFGSLPDSVISCIENSADSDALRKCLLFASQAASLQAVIDQINNMSGTNCPGQTVPHA